MFEFSFTRKLTEWHVRVYRHLKWKRLSVGCIFWFLQILKNKSTNWLTWCGLHVRWTRVSSPGYRTLDGGETCGLPKMQMRRSQPQNLSWSAPFLLGHTQQQVSARLPAGSPQITRWGQQIQHHRQTWQNPPQETAADLFWSQSAQSKLQQREQDHCDWLGPINTHRTPPQPLLQHAAKEA